MPGPADKICLALDLNDEREIIAAVDELHDLVGYFKINSAFTLFGPALVESMLRRGAKIFLDLKLHDIPNTLAGYGEAVTRLGIHIVTVHVAGGKLMLEEFVRSVDAAAQTFGTPRPKLIGISLLTSIDRLTMNREMNVNGSIEAEVLRRGRVAAEAGLDGLVSSAAELNYIKGHLPSSFYYVTPGVRPAGSTSHDHLRMVSYEDAIRAGSSLLVVGRAVLGSPNRREALRSLQNEIAEGRG